MSDPMCFIPMLYDPTVADAYLTFGHIYRRARGRCITRHMKGRIAKVLQNWLERDNRLIYLAKSSSSAWAAVPPSSLGRDHRAIEADDPDRRE
jgi:Malic enzyme, N-terminal domain